MVTPISARQAGLELAATLVERLKTTEIRVPPYPAVASSLDRLSRDGKSTVADVAAIVATDAALAATVLRHASSASLKSSAPATLEAAISRLGLDELTRVVVATTIGGAAVAPGPLALLRRDQWRRSLLAAMFCKELAARRGVLPDQAYLESDKATTDITAKVPLEAKLGSNGGLKDSLIDGNTIKYHWVAVIPCQLT